MPNAEGASATPPRVSVVMATWNGSRYIREQLRSIAAQDHVVDQVVIGDDGSTDGTVAICRSMASDFRQLDLRVNGHRLGPTNNFMAAISQAEGDIIILSDQDDIWRPNKVSSIIAAFHQHSPMAVYHSAELIDEKGQSVGLRFPDLGDDHSAPVSAVRPVYGMSLAFSARLKGLLANGYSGLMRTTCGHDFWIYAVAMMFGDVLHTSAALASYRQHPSNFTGVPRRSGWLVRNERRCDQYRQVVDRMTALLEAVQRWEQDGMLRDLHLRAHVVEHYRFVSHVYGQKLNLYDAGRPRGIAEKVAIIAKLFSAHAYEPRAETGLTRRSLMKDCVFALAPARLMRATP